MRITTQDITYEEEFWYKRTKLVYKNVRFEKGEDNTYVGVVDGKETIISIEGSFLMGINATIEDEKIELLKAPTFYEYILSFLFFVYIAVGVFKEMKILYVIAMAAILAIINFILIRQFQRVFFKILCSLIMYGIGFGCFMLISLLS